MPNSIKTKAELTHLDKIYWPKEGITKGRLLAYYDKISKILLPHLKNRLESLHRFPNGVSGESFFQKNLAGAVPDFVKTAGVHLETENRKITSIVCDNKDTLLYLVNLGCIEINPWTSRLKTLHKPDFAVIDLDPEGLGFGEVVKTALAARKVLEGLNIQSFPKTSGKRGLHIFIPMGAKYSFGQARQFVEIIVKLINKQIPEITSLERSPKKRRKKIYLDFLQNNIGQTLAAPYSVRPWPGATVSAPLLWKEVGPKLKPSDFNMESIFKRIEKHGDIWKPVLGKGIDLKKVLGGA